MGFCSPALIARLCFALVMLWWWCCCVLCCVFKPCIHTSLRLLEWRFEIRIGRRQTIAMNARQTAGVMSNVSISIIGQTDNTYMFAFSSLWLFNNRSNFKIPYLWTISVFYHASSHPRPHPRSPLTRWPSSPFHHLGFSQNAPSHKI